VWSAPWVIGVLVAGRELVDGDVEEMIPGIPLSVAPPKEFSQLPGHGSKPRDSFAEYPARLLPPRTPRGNDPALVAYALFLLIENTFTTGCLEAILPGGGAGLKAFASGAACN